MFTLKTGVEVHNKQDKNRKVICQLFSPQAKNIFTSCVNIIDLESASKHLVVWYLINTFTIYNKTS